MAAGAVIDDPLINSPFEEPARHFRFGEHGITTEVVEERRASSYFIPIPPPKKKGRQLSFETEWLGERISENAFINRVRARVSVWRRGGHAGVTRTTRRLLEHWSSPDRERRLFFCQIEAVETAIYLAEVASKYGDAWIENDLRAFNDAANPDLYRVAFKMATGSGKTVVMAMLIAWQALNKLANAQDARFSDAFLIVTPGITIRDRLRVLLPNDPGDYYRALDVVPPDLREELQKAKIVITNYHAFLPREKTEASRLAKVLSGQEATGVNRESPEQMVRRVCRDLAGKKGLVILNDEAHHCYRRRANGDAISGAKGEARREAEKRNEEARVWISGIEAVKAKLGVRVVYDLSATPFFLRGSGYSEGTLFPWVVSDFSLIDAIESGIVKVPRVPVADDRMTGEQPSYRELWASIRDELPRKGRGSDTLAGPPKLPLVLEGALQTLYGHYEKAYRRWEANSDARLAGLTPPVFIVVCNNTSVSKLVFDYVAGWEHALPDGTPRVVPGKLAIFSNERDGGWRNRPNTILVDSEQLESGDAMSSDFKTIAAAEIEEFKSDLRARFPGRDADAITDEDLLREVMNTIGRPGKLGEQVKCVVSVSMLTEGWDANTVTHILGVRAFGTQLLCEQVVGRGLRRMSYAPTPKTLDIGGRAVGIDAFSTEYAEVFGVPFSFIPTAGGTTDPKPGPTPTRVRALEDRIDCEITFPRVTGYRYILPARRLSARFGPDAKLALSTADVPVHVENAPIVGQTAIMSLDDLGRRREQEVAFLLAKLVLEKYFRADPPDGPPAASGNEQPRSAHGIRHVDPDVQAWLFPQVLEIARRWLAECVTCKAGTFRQLLLLVGLAHDAADRIYRSIVQTTEGEKTLVPILRPYDAVGSTRYVDFDTTRPTWKTDPHKCHVSHVVADTGSWEQKLAQVLESMPEVRAYVKNQNLGFSIPYTLGGEERQYLPDFIVRVDDGRGPDDLVNLIVECSGEPRKDKAAKVATARDLWVPAVDNDGSFGRWAFVEVTDPWDAEPTIRAALGSEQAGGGRRNAAVV